MTAFGFVVIIRNLSGKLVILRLKNHCLPYILNNSGPFYKEAEMLWQGLAVSSNFTVRAGILNRFILHLQRLKSIPAPAY